MIRLYSLILLAEFGLVAAAAVSRPDEFKYPANMKESNLIDDSIGYEKQMKKGANLIEFVSESLETKLEQLRTQKTPDVVKSIELLEQYLQMADITEAKCNPVHANGLSILLRLHQHAPESYAFRYLQEVAAEQFKLCLPRWDDEFRVAINSIDERDRSRMDRLLVQMMSIKFMREKDHPTKPYLRSQLRAMIAAPPASALLLFIADQGLISVDENVKNFGFPYEKFQYIYNNSVLRLCKIVSNSLESASEIFKYVFNYNVDVSKLGRENHERDEWLANKMLCSSIKRAHDDESGKDYFTEAAFVELTKPEEITIANENGIDELALFGLALDDEDEED